MTLTPAIKGQITKALNHAVNYGMQVLGVRRIFQKYMPREQAKHAARKFLAERNARDRAYLDNVVDV